MPRTAAHLPMRLSHVRLDGLEQNGMGGWVRQVQPHGCHCLGKGGAQRLPHPTHQLRHAVGGGKGLRSTGRRAKGAALEDSRSKAGLVSSADSRRVAVRPRDKRSQTRWENALRAAPTPKVRACSLRGLAAPPACCAATRAAVTCRQVRGWESGVDTRLMFQTAGEPFRDRVWLIIGCRCVLGTFLAPKPSP